MQTFLPYRDITQIAKVLDNKRLGKQRVECFQIINILEGKTNTWKNHPAVLMWDGYAELLKFYFNKISEEWVNRGFTHSMNFYEIPNSFVYPYWWSDERIFRSHQCNLLRKDFNHYSQYWDADTNAPYFWPTGLKNKKMNEKMLEYWERKK